MKVSDFVLVLLFLFVIEKAYSQLPKKTDGPAMKAIISEIASDDYKGRQTGSAEGIKAEEYMASEFRKLGLKPAGEKGTYFHTFSYSDYNVDNAELTIDGSSYLSGYDLDFELMYKSDGGEADGEIVFAGYGIISTELKRNDFDSITIKDKIVLMKRGCPGYDFDKWGKVAIDSVKAQYCYENGAKAVLFFSPSNYSTKQLIVSQNWIADYDIIKDFPVFLIKDHVVRAILNNSKMSYSRMMNRIDSKHVSFNTGKKAVMKAKLSKQKGFARNVLAMIPGTDPKLKNEYIIIGGHLDHLGVNSNNEICNGADDNASGPAVTLGIAQAMIKNKFKPKRTIVFACWMGEEMGLLGSEAWCNTPTLDIYKTIVYFNLDMVGLGDGNLDMPGIDYAPEVTAFIKANTDSISLKKINWSEGGLGGSDHNNFLLHGIPAFAGMTSGEHPDYHKKGDDSEKIREDILQFVGDFIYHCTEMLSQSKQNFISKSRFEQNQKKLQEQSWYTPVFASDFVEQVMKFSPRLAVVNFSEGLNNVPEQNLISIFKEYVKAEKLAVETKKMKFKTAAYDIATHAWRDNTCNLIPALNLSSIGYNELYVRTLSSFGFKLGIIDSTFLNYSDSVTRKRFIESVNSQLMGIVLDNPDLNKMQVVLDDSKSPVLILAGSNTILNEKAIQSVKEKKHLVALQVSSQTSAVELKKKILMFEEKLGKNRLALTIEANQLSKDQFGLRMAELKKLIGEDHLYDLTDGNFCIFMMRSLQEFPPKINWRNY